MDRNITVNCLVGGPQIVTFSIVYEEEGCVQCYVYWNGQMHRFVPTEMEQTRAVLTEMFKMGNAAQFESNNTFLDRSDGRVKMRELGQMMRDPQFMYFRK